MKTVVRIFPGVYQLAIPMPNSPLGYLLSYLIEGQDGYLMVDTGWNTSVAWETLLEQLQQLDLHVGDIKKILVTHLHPDHIGLAGKIKKLSGAKIYLHREDAKILGTRYEDVQYLLKQVNRWLVKQGVPDRELQQFTEASMPVKEHVAPLKVDVRLDGGETIPTAIGSLQVVWTPGHSPGETCFYLGEKKLLFSGDHILPGVSPNIGLHPQNMSDPLASYLNSLDKVEKLEVDMVLPGHEHVFTDAKERIKALREHHLHRIEMIIDRLKIGPGSAYQIASALKWGPGEWKMLSNWDRRMAMMEVLAHLEYMKHEEMVVREEQDGVKVYRLTALRQTGSMV